MKKYIFFLSLFAVLIYLSSPVNATLLNNISYYYKFDETSGTTAIDSTGFFNGTNSNAYVNLSGKINTSYGFNSDSARYVDIGDFSTIESGNVMTVSAWMKLNNTGSLTNTIFRNDIAGFPSTIMFRTDASPTLQFYMTGTALTVPFTLNTNWRHVVAVYNSTHMLIYIDGNLTGTPVAKTGNIGTIGGTFRIGQGNSASENMRGQIDEFGVWKRALTQAEITQLYNAGSGSSYPFGSDIVSYFNITATNSYNSVAINNFTANISNGTFSTVFSTTNGTINTNILTNSTSLFNITINTSNYFPVTYTNYNISTTLNAQMFQATATFTASTFINATSILTGNVTINSVTYPLGTVWNLSSGNYSATFSHANYFNKTQTFEALPLTTNSFNIANVSDQEVNITAVNILNSAAISNFTIFYTRNDGLYSSNTSTTSGSIRLNLTGGNWSFSMDAPGYALNSSTANLIGLRNSTNIPFRLFTTNSINITFRDSLSNLIITSTNITVDFISDLMSRRNVTSNGLLYIDLLSPSAYTMRATAPNYAETALYLNVSNRTTQQLTVYMQNYSAGAVNITLAVVDITTAPVRNALVRVQKYDITTNTYIQQYSALTNDNGRIYFSGFLFSEYYRFVIEYPFGTVVYTSNPGYLTSTSLPAFIIDTGIITQTGYEKSQGITASTAYNNNTQVASFTWTDPNSVSSNFCLKVLNSRGTTINSSCSTSQSGQLLLIINNTQYTSFTVNGVATIGGIDYIIAQTQYENNEIDLGQAGLLIVFLITVVLIFMFRSDPSIMLIALPLPLTLGVYFGFVALEMWIPICLWIIVISLNYIVRVE